MPSHQLLEYLCEPIKESGVEKASFSLCSLLQGTDQRYQWYKNGSGYVLSCAVLVGQVLENSCHGHCKGKLPSCVVRINLPFVKMRLAITQGRNTITDQDNFLPSF